ncbi:polysaccharide deacetylase family protein [Pelomonas sp. Root1237]|uniref:polysaccharide deacetylase family protein n=1 Tax=Pelomonas sp. Root1237 TaxID=1736434 RepID=UPI0006FAD23C|nr:polysaccharide deacetylase family protein [Pelomonas sp. Root1237]KQV96122.1 polysaccharide deacetylase [Pelomonas sp. Root1237]
MRLISLALLLTIAFALTGCNKRLSEVPAALPAASAAQDSSATAKLREEGDGLLALHRQIVVLMDGEATLPAAQRREVQALGQQLFHELLQRQQRLADLALKPESLDATAALLTRIESEPSWFDADRLAFKEVLSQLATGLKSAQTLDGIKLARRAQEDLDTLAEVEKAYEQELKEVFGGFAKRGIELKRERERWSDYVAKLKALHTRDAVMKQHGAQLPAAADLAPEPAASGAMRGVAAKEREVFGDKLPPKTVLLTFDDGPHARYTDEILEILKRYNAPAVFFQLGQNLGKVDADGKIQPGNGSAVAKRVLAAGHQLANHSFTHELMSKFELVKVKEEAANTEALLDAAGRNGDALFRFPYGARNDGALTTIEALKLRSMMWNVDSLDWSDPIPKSIAARVMAELDKQQRGIVLFHDIHARTVQALPLVLDQLAAEGWRFASWKDGQFVVSTDKTAAAPPPAPGELYRDSHALVIGINQYAAWPKLSHAVRDAQAVRESLVTRFGFRADNVTLLTDAEATRANILKALNERFGDAKRVKRDDRVFVFFAGHGSTRKLPSGREVGYIVPVDAGLNDLQADAIAMPQLQEVAEAITAKHALFVIDACYSGLGLTRGGSAAADSNFARTNARRIGRQMMTAGGADQQVADDGPGGHSVFTWTLLQALNGKADLNGDGLITATELAAYVAPAVSSIAHQTPAFGSLPGSEGGEFIFELPTAQEPALSGAVAQLDDKASQFAAKLDEASTAGRQVSAAASGAASGVQVTIKGLDGKDQALAATTARVDPGARVAAQRANDRGLQLYRERRYDEAEAAFKEALQLQPKFALAANNLGFVLYRRGKPADAAVWFEKAVEMDGSRSLAWLNLGDARLLAGDEGKAMAAYKTFLELAPKHARAAELQGWIANPSEGTRPKPV